MAKIHHNMNAVARKMQSRAEDAEFLRMSASWVAQRAELAAQITEDTEYKRLAWNVVNGIGETGLNEDLMFAKECQVAGQILRWLNENPHSAHYGEYIKAVPHDSYLESESTSTLHFNLWLRTNASVWINPRDANSHNDLLWKLSIIRLSCYLNTGSF